MWLYERHVAEPCYQSPAVEMLVDDGCKRYSCLLSTVVNVCVRLPCAAPPSWCFINFSIRWSMAWHGMAWLCYVMFLQGAWSAQGEAMAMFRIIEAMGIKAV